MTLRDLVRPRWKHSDPGTRREAVSELRDVRILADVVTRDADQGVREAAVRALGATRNPAATSILLNLLDERWSPLVVVAAFAASGDVRSVEPLTKALAEFPKAASGALLALGWCPSSERERALVAAGREDWAELASLGQLGPEAINSAFAEGGLRDYAAAADAAGKMGLVLVFGPRCPVLGCWVVDEFEFDPAFPLQGERAYCNSCGEALDLRFDDGQLRVSPRSRRQVFGWYGLDLGHMPVSTAVPRAARQPQGDVLLRSRIDAGSQLPAGERVEYYRRLASEMSYLSPQKLLHAAPADPGQGFLFLDGIPCGRLHPRLEYHRRYLQMRALLEMGRESEAKRYAVMALLADSDPACAAWDHVRGWFPEHEWDRLSVMGKRSALEQVRSRLED
jgi:hypothetical protein